MTENDDFDPDEYIGSLLHSSLLPPPQTLGGPDQSTRRTWLRQYLPNASLSDLRGFPLQYQEEVLVNRFNGHLQFDIVDWKEEWPSLVQPGLRVVDRLFEPRASNLDESIAPVDAPKTSLYDLVKRLAEYAFEDNPEAKEEVKENLERLMMEIARNVIWGSYRSDK